MIEKQLKRAIWVMNEINMASTRGITREELSEKWENSAMNDYEEKSISERTFYRIRRLLESVFDVDIECEKGTELRYRISADYLEPGNSSLLSLLLNKKESEKRSKPSYMLDILNMIMSGKEIPSDDLQAMKSIAGKLNRIPYDYGMRLMASVKSGEFFCADSCEWDEYYLRYVCVWNEADYVRTGFWLSIGFSDNSVMFYIVTSVQDPEYREKNATMLQVESGKKYRGGYWWYEPADKSLFKLDFQTFPDMREVKRRVEMLIAKIAALPANIHKPKE